MNVRGVLPVAVISFLAGCAAGPRAGATPSSPPQLLTRHYREGEALRYRIDGTHIKQTATLSVRHVPPHGGCERVPADWMRKRIFDTQNNWFEITKTAAGSYDAEVGKETFAADITILLPSGVIQSATLFNPVELEERTCKDAPLSDCVAPKKSEIIRRIKLTLES